MGKTEAADNGEPSDLPRVEWLLKPSMEIEAIARWRCCHEELNGADGEGAKGNGGEESGDASGHSSQARAAKTLDDSDAEGPKDERCYLCPEYKSRAKDEEECWRAAEREIRKWLNEILKGTFPEKATVVVVGWLRSFTFPHDRPALRVEVTEGNSLTPEAYIVKLALPSTVGQKEEPNPVEKPGPVAEISEELQIELDGYGYLGPHGKKKAGSVFATLEEGHHEGGRPDGGLLSLIYHDAEQTLRAGDTVVTLERAVLDACNGNQRFLDSVEATIVQLFAELEDAWYRNAHARAVSATGSVWLKQRLEPGHRNWLDLNEETGRARDEVLWALSDPDIEFIDPALYFNPNPKSWPRAPEMLVGTAHGDLHARNVLVGIVEGEARWPIVFDYEDVLCCNPVALDFVKMETELKKAAFSNPSFLKAGNDKELIQKFYAFEFELNDRTERCYNHNSWSEPMNGSGPQARLAHIILSIRRMAWRCLELRRGRSRKWLHEYYFMLAWYGVYAARFAGFRELRPLKSLFLSAGMAAFRHAYGEDLGQRIVELRRADALVAIAAGCTAKNSPKESANSKGQTNVADAACPLESQDDRNANDTDPSRITAWTKSDIYKARGNLEYAKQLARSRKWVCIEQAIELLNRLMNEHPFVLEPTYECIFALLELAQLAESDEERKRHWDEADRLLKRADVQFRRQMHHELLSRRGRLYKDQAHACLKDGEFERAKTLYKQAAESYKDAAEVSEPEDKHYPGINAATCYWFADQEKNAKAMTTKVLKWVKREEKRLQKGKAEKDLMWVRATKGEAYVIAGLAGNSEVNNWCGAAKEAYEDALKIARREGELKQQSVTMVQQLERILKVAEIRLQKDDSAEFRANVPKLAELIKELKLKADL